MGNTTSNMKYNAYPEYKDSGVEWLGKIPAHWGIIPLKYLAELNPKKSAMDTALLSKECSFLPMDKLKTDTLVLDETCLVRDVYNGYTYFEDGDVLMAKVTPCFENKNMAVASGLLNGLGFGSSEIYVLRSNGFIKNRFLYYRLQEDSFMDIAIAAMTGAGGLRRIPSEVVNGYSFAVPEIEEQTTIANFLDHETAKIDVLLEQQKKLINLLKEKRHAIINHAVTKGLNPNVPMKDSGVTWLGEIPEHWFVRRLKHTATIQSGIPKGKDLTGKRRISVPMLRVANVQDGYLDLDDVHEIDIEPHELERYSLRVGDVLMNEGGDNDKLGRGAVWPGKISPCIHQNHVFSIRVKDIESDWLSWLTSAIYTKYYFYSVAKQSTNLASISSSNIKETPLIIPPKAERWDIMKYLDVAIKKIDKIESQSKQQIKLLQERRTALISAAVTGKIDVRQWQAPTSEVCHATQETSL